MSGSGFEVPPLSRIEIRNIAKKIRAVAETISGKNEPHFPIVKFLDVYLPKIVPEFSLEVVEKGAMGTNHGMTYPEEHLIQIREDIYLRAYDEHGRDRLTLAHELGHYVLHSNLGLARTEASAQVKPFRNSEWQANAFAGELLVSADYIHLCKNSGEAARIFGVSFEAAEIQWNAFSKGGLINK